jgi:hypothetical protein
VEYVEVGHCRGDAVELIHQRRLDIIEKLGAHKAQRLTRFAFQRVQKRSYPKKSFSVYTRGSPKPVLQTEKLTDNLP